MNNLFTDWPAVPWKSGWQIASGPDDTTAWITRTPTGELGPQNAEDTLHLVEPSLPCSVTLFSNGLSIRARKKPEQNRIDLLAVAPGVLSGRATGLPIPKLSAPDNITDDGRVLWLQKEHSVTVFLRTDDRFALVHGPFTLERAVDLAESAAAEKFNERIEKETEKRQSAAALFSINPEHNPPVALAAENLSRRLRERTPAIHGLWSAAGGFETDTFSLNELYPLARAWNLINPDTALKLVQTAFSLQQNTGGFPSWINIDGQVSSAAPWPLIAQAFETVWNTRKDPALLKKHLPALRKYIQWALRRFDPRRDGIPAWQSPQEVFVPDTYERGQAVPELTVMLLTETEAVLRLCEQSDHAETAVATLTQERDRLVETLDRVFWNSETNAYSNAWKDGHYIHAPTFGSFMPLFWNGLSTERRTAIIETFDETRGFPGQKDNSDWIHDRVTDRRVPSIHQFMALEALRLDETFRPQRMLFVRRLRESFTAWFEHESIEAARGESNGNPAYDIGPVTAALILTAQAEFENETSQTPTTARQILQWMHRRKFDKTDLRILGLCLLAIVIIHLIYAIPHRRQRRDTEPRMAEAALAYSQRRYSDALEICRRYPDNTLSQFLQANLLMLAGLPEQAEPLYREALLKKTESPSALLGYALAMQLNGKHRDAVRRYVDFLDIHENNEPAAAELADEFRRYAEEGFSKPPRWQRVYALPIMNSLGL